MLKKGLIMNFEITDVVSDRDKNEIFQGLLEYNLSKLEDKNPKELGIYYRVDGVIKGGLVGLTHGSWLMVEYLWVSEEIRKCGIGSELLLAAEEEAKNRGCKYVFLNTFSFQAPDFYKKHGYKEVFALENYPINGKRHYLIKNLK